MSAATLAQNTSVTPYSRFGFGELEDRSLGNSYALGGAGIGLSDTALLNILNPASYAMVARHRPLFNVGLRGKLYSFETKSSSDVGRTVYLKNINFGIPVKKRWGFSFGLMPFSTVGYGISSEQNVDGVGDVTFEYNGEGGTNRVYSGVAWRAIDKEDHVLSVGANAGYLFGSTSRSRAVLFGGKPYVNTKIEETILVKDFVFDAGLLYTGMVSEKFRYSLGATFFFPNDLRAERDQVETTWLADGVVNTTVDTADVTAGVEGSIYIPKKIAYGAAFDIRTGKEGKNSRRWLLLLDYASRNWEDYTQTFDSISTGDQLSTSTRLSFGVQFEPLYVNLTARTPKFWEKVDYRMGFRYVNTQIQVNDEQLEEYGISFGVGIPISTRGSLTSINLGCDLSRQGTVENNLIQENRLGFHIGMSMSPMSHERWFVKRKYD